MKTLLIFAHPDFKNSVFNRELLKHLPKDSSVTFHDVSNIDYT